MHLKRWETRNFTRLADGEWERLVPIFTFHFFQGIPKQARFLLCAAISQRTISLGGEGLQWILFFRKANEPAAANLVHFYYPCNPFLRVRHRPRPISLLSRTGAPSPSFFHPERIYLSRFTTRHKKRKKRKKRQQRFDKLLSRLFLSHRNTYRDAYPPLKPSNPYLLPEKYL